MDILEALHTRRSIRKYTDTEISDADLHEILKCAMLAPSACNEQPWHFVAVRDEGQRKVLSGTTKYTHMAANAPLVIVVCASMQDDKAEGFWPQDCAAAIENMMLAARGLNIGAVWCGIYPVEEREAYLRKALSLPEDIVPMGMVCLGYPEQHFHEVDRFREDRIHYEKW